MAKDAQQAAKAAKAAAAGVASSEKKTKEKKEKKVEDTPFVNTTPKGHKKGMFVVISTKSQFISYIFKI